MKRIEITPSIGLTFTGIKYAKGKLNQIGATINGIYILTVSIELIFVAFEIYNNLEIKPLEIIVNRNYSEEEWEFKSYIKNKSGESEIVAVYSKAV